MTEFNIRETTRRFQAAGSLRARPGTRRRMELVLWRVVPLAGIALGSGYATRMQAAVGDGVGA